MQTALSQPASKQIDQVSSNDQAMIGLFIATKRSANTKTQYGHSIKMLLDCIGKPLQGFTLQDAITYHDHLKGAYRSVHSVKLHINVAKAIFSFALSMNYVRSNPFAPVKTDTAPEITHKRILTEEQVLKLIDAPKKERDRLALRLMYAAGLRAGELCDLMWSDLSSDGVLHIRNGKGQKSRFVTLSEGMIDRLTAYRGENCKDGYIFQSQQRQNKAGDLLDGRLDESQLHRIIKSAAKLAGVDQAASLHWLRHSHASHSLDRGASLVTVRDTLGHASIATTNKYLHAKRRDSSALHLAV